MSAEARKVLQYLASKPRVDMRWLDDSERRVIRTVLDDLHNRRTLSLLQISREVGKSYTKIWGLCRALEIPTRSVAEADRNSATRRSKHKKRPFHGREEEKAYLTGFANGDLSAWRVSGISIMVTSTTTHPAFANLFRTSFQEFGPVYQYPMHEHGKGYKWKLAARLDNSFEFLTKRSVESLRYFSSSRSYLVHWLVGLVDSDGNIRVSENNGYARAFLAIYSTNLRFLESLKNSIENIGYHVD